jgi:anaerobic magnesium-protoporphyrin IX monomethyl ester cyclase
MKVLFFYIDTQTSTGPSTGLGIALLSGYMKKHSVDTGLVYFRSQDDFKYAMDRIASEKPDIVGFSSMSVNWKTVAALSKDIRESFPNTFQIYGGIHATLVPGVLESIESLDAVCIGYGEKPLLELCNRLGQKGDISDIPGLWIRRRQGGSSEIIKNTYVFPDSDLQNDIAFDHGIFLNEVARFSDSNPNSDLDVIFTRGCPFGCSFCCNAQLKKVNSGHIFRPSPDAAVEALKDALKKTGKKSITIHDDILTLNKNWLHQFTQRYAAEVNLPFTCNLRAGTFSEEDIKSLKKAGMSVVWLGVESGNDYIRNTVMNKQVTDEQILDAAALLHRYGIRIRTFNIIGVPCETPQRFIDTIRINARCWPVELAILTFFYPYPMTALHDLSIRESLVKDDFQFAERMRPSLNLPGFPEEKMLAYFANFDNLIRYQRYRNRMPFVFLIPLNARTSFVIIRIIKSVAAVCRVARNARRALRRLAHNHQRDAL